MMTFNCDEFRCLLMKSCDTGDSAYDDAKKLVLKLFYERRKIVEALEKEHVLHDVEVGILDFLEICDRYKDAVIDLEVSDEDEDYDEEEKNKEFEFAEENLNDCVVPLFVWSSLWH